MSNKNNFIPHPGLIHLSEEEMMQRASDFKELMQKRRTVRDFSDKAVPRKIIEDCLMSAGTAPNGANKQPWHFVAVSDPQVKQQIRIAAEEEEHEFYHHKAPDDWLEDLVPFGTNELKPFLEKAPYLIAIFSQSYNINEQGEKEKHYYVKESVGIATGMLITAIHNAGLVSLTHTPSPMGFLNKILGRPSHEKPFLLLVVGYPADEVMVPDIEKKSLDQMSTFI